MVHSKNNTFGKNIIYYCKDCEKIVDAQRIGRKYVFRCPICKTKNVAFGTEKSIRSFYHVKEDEDNLVRETEKLEKSEPGEK